MAEFKNNNNTSMKNNSIKVIKSNNILKRIFNYLRQKVLLNITRYNKYIKNKLNIDINDFKNEFLKIKIEIIPVENIYGKFINFYHKETYYKVYINDNVEIKRYYITESDNAKKITIEIDCKFKSLYGLFRDCKCVKKINFFQFNKTDINNMGHLFSECYFLN